MPARIGCAYNRVGVHIAVDAVTVGSNGAGFCAIRDPLHSVCADGFLAGRRNVVSPGRLEDFLSPGYLLGTIAVHREEDAAVLDTAFIAFRFILRNSHTDQSTYHTAHCAAHSESGECAHDRTGRDKRAHTRYSQGANVREQSKCSPAVPPTPTPVTAPSGALVSSAAKSLEPSLSAIRTEMSACEKPAEEKLIDCELCGRSARINAKCCCVLSCHGDLLSTLRSVRSLLLNCELIGNLIWATYDRFRLGSDTLLLLLRLHWSL